MRFEHDGASTSVPEAVAAGQGTAFGTTVVAGEGEPVGELVVPYRGEQLSGDDLLRQLDDWVAAGTVEPSCAQALRRVVATPEWLDLRDRSFALLGAAAELGPVAPLLSWGAQVAAVDLPVARLQERLVAPRAGAPARCCCRWSTAAAPAPTCWRRHRRWPGWLLEASPTCR